MHETLYGSPLFAYLNGLELKLVVLGNPTDVILKETRRGLFLVWFALGMVGKRRISTDKWLGIDPSTLRFPIYII